MFFIIYVNKILFLIFKVNIYFLFHKNFIDLLYKNFIYLLYLFEIKIK